MKPPTLLLVPTSPTLISGFTGAGGQSAIIIVAVFGLAFIVGRVRHRYQDIDVF